MVRPLGFDDVVGTGERLAGTGGGLPIAAWSGMGVSVGKPRPRNRYEESKKHNCECVCECDRKSDYMSARLCSRCNMYHDGGHGDAWMRFMLKLNKLLKRERCWCACGCSMKKQIKQKACNYCLGFCHPNKYTMITKLLKLLSH